MQNRNIITIIIANLLWSLIPVVVVGLFDEVSVLMIVFLRFFVSGIILFLIVAIVILVNNKFHDEQDMKISLKKLLKFTTHENESFYNMKYFYYFALLGFFGIVLHIISFFLALKTTSIAFTMIGFQLSIIIVAFYEHGVKSERLDFFKVLYIIILLFTIGIIILVQFQDPKLKTLGLSIEGIYYVILFTICVSFLHIGMGRETYSKGELRFLNKNPNYKICRLILKLSLIFLIGIGLMFPFLLIIYFIPIPGELTIEIEKFFSEFPNIFQILLRWELLFLIFFSTIITFLLLFIASINWTDFDLSFSQWSSILTIIEPIGGILFAVILLGEYFPIGYLTIIIFLLIISILLRYAHESKNKVNAYILLKQQRGNLENLHLRLLKIDGITSVSSLIGEHDLLINAKTNSIKDLYYIINTGIRNMEEISEIKIIFIDKIIKLTN